MNQISAKLAKLLLGSGDHTGNFGPLVGQCRHDVTFRHTHPRSQNDRGDYLLQADMMSAMRLVFMRLIPEFSFLLLHPRGRPHMHQGAPETMWIDGLKRYAEHAKTPVVELLTPT